MSDVNDFSQEKQCTYKGERYSVRDNGAVFRHQREGKRTRRNDNKWTFGKVGDKGYLYIAGIQVHRIIATAFHGEHLSREYIVDHKDTNKQNNRPENLHWCTREENVLNNPNTIKKIEYRTGHSIDEVRKDWSILHNLEHKQDTSWMRPVTQEEAENLKDRQLEWQQNKKQSPNGVMGEWAFNRNNKTNKQKYKSDFYQNNTIRKQTEKERVIEEEKDQSKFDETVEKIFQKVEKETGLNRESLLSKTKKAKYYKARIYAAKLLRSEMDLSDETIGRLIGRSKSMVNAYLNQTDFNRGKKVDNSLVISQTQTNNSEFAEPDIIESLTPNAVQRKWQTPSEFPCCPQEYTEEPLRTYANNLIKGSVFCRNNLYSSLVFKSSASEDKQTIYVISESTGMKPLALAKITFENGKFVHTSLGSFFSQEGAEKQFCQAQGLQWHGGDSIDDYC